MAENYLRDLASVRRRFGEVNTALESICECPLPAPAGVNLCFHDKSASRTDSSGDEIDISKLVRDLFDLVGCRSAFAARCRHIKFLQQFPGLILVNIHRLPAQQIVQLACVTHRGNGFSLISRGSAARFSNTLLQARATRWFHTTGDGLPYDFCPRSKRFPTVRCSVGGSSALTNFRNRSEKTSGRSLQ